MRLNPRQLQCCYTNHDSSHMLAANGAPVPPPRSPRSGQAILAVHPGRAAGNRKRPGPAQDRGQAGWGELLGHRDAAGTSAPSRSRAGPPLPGDRRLQVNRGGIPGSGPGGSQCCSRGTPPPCLTITAAPIPGRRGWAHSRSAGGGRLVTPPHVPFHFPPR